MTVCSWNEKISSLPLFERGSAVTIGSFDGPHLGHEALLNEVLVASKKNDLIPGVITFTKPLPNFKHPSEYPGDIATLNQRLFQFERHGFSFVVLIDFDSAFSQMTGTDFFSALRSKYNVRFIAEGPDFKCGHNGSFSATDITAFAQKNGITAVFPKLVRQNSFRISSSEIRKFIHEGQFEEAKKSLGRSYTLELTADMLIPNENSFCVQRNLVSQVIPKNGEYKALLGGKTECQVIIADESILIKPSVSIFSKSKTLEVEFL